METRQEEDTVVHFCFFTVIKSKSQFLAYSIPSQLPFDIGHLFSSAARLLLAKSRLSIWNDFIHVFDYRTNPARRNRLLAWLIILLTFLHSDVIFLHSDIIFFQSDALIPFSCDRGIDPSAIPSWGANVAPEFDGRLLVTVGDDVSIVGRRWGGF